MFNKVTIKGAKQAVQMFGPAQHAVAKAVADSVAEGVIPQDEADDLFICVGVFIHWEAADDKKIQDYNYRAVKESIARAVTASRRLPRSSQNATKSNIRSPPYSDPDRRAISFERSSFVRRRHANRKPASYVAGRRAICAPDSLPLCKHEATSAPAIPDPRERHQIDCVAYSTRSIHKRFGRQRLMAKGLFQSGPIVLPTRPSVMAIMRRGQASTLLSNACGPTNASPL